MSEHAKCPAAVALLLLLSIVGVASASTASDASGDAWVLLRLTAEDDFPLRAIVLHNAGMDRRERINFRWRQRSRDLTLRKFAPGDYFVSEIITQFQNVSHVKFSQPEDLAEVRPGRITYLGDVVANGKRVPNRGYRSSYRHRFSRSTVVDAVTHHPEAFNMLPSYAALPGMAPTPFDALALAQDSYSGATDHRSRQGLFQIRDSAWWLRVTADRKAHACWRAGGEILTVTGIINEGGEVSWNEPLLPPVRWQKSRFLLLLSDGETALEKAGDELDAHCAVALYSPA